MDAKTQDANRYLYEKNAAEAELKRVLVLHEQEKANHKTTIATHQSTLASLQDPANPRHLKYKNIRLEKENAEIPKLRSRIEQADKERTELLALRSKEAEFKEKVQYADTLARELYLEGEVVKSLKQEKIELKKNTTQH